MSKPRLATGVGDAIIWLLFFALLVPAGLVGWVIGHQSSRTVPAGTTSLPAVVTPAVAAGAHVFVQFACAQCHGPQGEGGVSAFVPALSNVGTKLTSAQLRHIIDHGLGESA